MKVKLAAVIVALSVIAFAGSAFAGWSVPGELGSTDAPGSSVFFNYYDIRTMAQGGPGLTDNYFTVVSNEDDEWINAHVRVRTGQCSVELLDFDVLLSPLDVFTFDLYQGENGATVFASCDTHTLTASGFDVDAGGCFVLDTTTFPNQLALIQTCGNCPDGSSVSAAEALEATRWGYVEVIGEAEITPDSTTPCTGTCCEADIEAGLRTAWSLLDGGDCDYIDSVDRHLFGRVYYAMLDGSGNLMRLGQQNGHSLWQYIRPGEIHRPCYSDSSPGCSSGDGELENPTGPGYAYDAATTGTPAGAQDLNYCFWADTITSTGDVINRNGAAATFGPTWADYHSRGPANTTTNGLVTACDHIDKDIAFSHYFYVPGLGETRFVFTFPVQHFLAQTIAVTKDLRADTEQNTCVLPSQKFISPGLPTPTVARGEVTIIEADEGEACAFNEGWINFDLETTADGPGSCGSACGSPPSTAGWDSACTIQSVVNWGMDGVNVMAVSPMQYNPSINAE